MLKNYRQEDINRLYQLEKKARHILGVSETENMENIKRAWHRLSLEFHPDKNQGSRQSHYKFIVINCAYMFLSEGKCGRELDSYAPVNDNFKGEFSDVDTSTLENYLDWWQNNFSDPV